MTSVLDFLTCCFHKGYEYNTIAGYRSAISVYHDTIEGFVVGQHPRVSALLSGIFNNRPPQPKYNFIWDVKKVLDFLVTLKSDNECSLKVLTLKLTMLLALTSAARASEVCFLDTKYLVRHPSVYIFQFGRITKTARPGKPRKPIEFQHFNENRNLCVCNYIDLYIDKTKDIRGDESQLLISFVKPHKAVSTQTVSRWILEVLSQAGIDTKTFSGHSTRSASSSKAKARGVPIGEILKRGFWSQSTTFEKFYHKEILAEDPKFQASVLQL